MAIDRLPPGGNFPPLITGRLIIDTYRGRMRWRSWPRKRGKPRNYKNIFNTERFREAAKLTKYAPTTEYQRAVELAHNTGLYPQDLIRSAMLGGQIDIETEEGEVWQKYIPYVHPTMFQGARIIRTSDMSLPGATATVIPWQSPTLDTAGFWSIGNPSRLTIPENVTHVILFAGLESQQNVTGTMNVTIRDSGGNPIARMTNDNAGFRALVATTGPIPVSEADWFEVISFTSNTRTLTAIGSTYFGLLVVGAT